MSMTMSLVELCQIVGRLAGQIPAAPATRWSGASHATGGKPHRKAESRLGHGPSRRCTHLVEMRFPAPSTRGAGAGGIRPEEDDLTKFSRTPKSRTLTKSKSLRLTAGSNSRPANDG
jgi:hypothetical protein